MINVEFLALEIVALVLFGGLLFFALGGDSKRQREKPVAIQAQPKPVEMEMRLADNSTQVIINQWGRWVPLLLVAIAPWVVSAFGGVNAISTVPSFTVEGLASALFVYPFGFLLSRFFFARSSPAVYAIGALAAIGGTALLGVLGSIPQFSTVAEHQLFGMGLPLVVAILASASAHWATEGKGQPGSMRAWWKAFGAWIPLMLIVVLVVLGNSIK